MSIKTIAVIFDESAEDEQRIAYAASLALHFDAHLIGILLLSATRQEDAAASYSRGHEAITAALRHREELDRTTINIAKTRFENAVSSVNVGHEFRVHGYHDDEHRLRSLHADLVVASTLKGKWSSDTQPPDVLQLATGIPFLLLPPDWRSTEPPRNILVGWNGSREARRAIGDALPLLTGADSVTVLIVDPESTMPQSGASGTEIASFLLRHGVRLTIEPVQSQGRAIASAIMDFAGNGRYDLIALGAYSHSRSRELIFGGVTRSLLANSTVPLLIAH